jgi:hypothetical protein
LANFVSASLLLVSRSSVRTCLRRDNPSAQSDYFWKLKCFIEEQQRGNIQNEFYTLPRISTSLAFCPAERSLASHPLNGSHQTRLFRAASISEPLFDFLCFPCCPLFSTHPTPRALISFQAVALFRVFRRLTPPSPAHIIFNSRVGCGTVYGPTLQRTTPAFTGCTARGQGPNDG